jgi:XisI protein
MDRINEYRQIVCEFLSNFVAEYDKNGQLIFDIPHDRYLVMHNEWQDDDRIYGCAMQLDIIEGQIWIQHNSTEIYIDRELIKLGVSPQDIIFGFRSPSIRKLLANARNA